MIGSFMDTASGAGAGEARELVAFRLGGQEFALDIMAVREIRGWTPPTPLPEAPAYVTGVVSLRGLVLPIVDLAQRLGFPSTEACSRHAIVVVETRDGLVGLLVEGVSEIMAADPGSIQPTPSVSANSQSLPVQGLISLGERMISLLVLDSLFEGRSLKAA